MANLTISVEDEVLQSARQRALAQGTSVNALLRDYLESFAGVRAAQDEAVQSLLERSARARSGGGSRVSRDELHER